MYNLTKSERETIINYCEDSNEANIYTCSKPVMRKLDKMCEKYPQTYRLIKRDEISAEYSCPVNRIRYAVPISEKQKQARSQNILTNHL